MIAFKVKCLWHRDDQVEDVEATDALEAATTFAKSAMSRRKFDDIRVEVQSSDGGVRRYHITKRASLFVDDRIWSPPLTLFRLVRQDRGDQWELSRIAKDHADQAALRLAIVSGMRFDPDDCSELSETYGHYATEHDYATACGDRGVANRSFCQSFERWRERKPFIVRDRGARTGTRMHVGRRFQWFVDGKMETLTCTSFSETQARFGSTETTQSFIGTLTTDARHKGPTKVLRRVRIDHAAIKAFHRHLDGKTDGAK